MLSSSIEYSANISMSDVINCSNTKINLNPGTDLYFRLKATENSFASLITTLDVPAKPSTPSYTFNYITEKTVQNVTSDIEYATNVSFTSAINGTGTQVTVTPGQNLYFRKKATSSSFASGIFQLECASRPESPAVTVDFINEKTNEVLSSANEYSSNIAMSDVINCSNAKINLNPGTNLYFRLKATENSFASLITTLNVPARPSTPAITINYTTEKTVQNITSDIEYATNVSFTSAINGTGTQVTITPGQNLYFRKKSTSSSFVSGIFQMDCASRPGSPAVTVDFINEKTNEVLSSAIEYSTNISMSDVINCSNTKINLNPGTYLYFRLKATENAFASLITTLEVPEKPSTPSYTFDFITEKTVQNVTSDIEYATNVSFTNAINGTGTQVTITPGQNLYFRKKATSSSFASGIFQMECASRPGSPAVTVDFINEKTNEVLSSAIEYSANIAMSDVINCSNAKIKLNPGTDLYFRMKATDNSFASLITTLIVPERPPTPAITLNFSDATTSVVAPALEWSENSSLSPATQGDGNSISVIPGVDLYFRVRVTSSSFRSLPQHLEIPGKPLPPEYTINYITETTAESIAENIEYSTFSDLSNASLGEGDVITLNAGQNLYFRQVAGSSSFKSDIFELQVPERVSLIYTGLDTIYDDSFEMQADSSIPVWNLVWIICR